MRSMLLFSTWKDRSIARLLRASVTQAEARHRLPCRHVAFYMFFFEEILDGMGSLEGHNLMDYSFLVAIKVGADGLDGLVKVS